MKKHLLALLVFTILCLLISFAAGALLAVALLDILPETIELAGTIKGLGCFLSGYVLFWLVTRFIFHICPACSATHTEVNFKAVTNSEIGFLILFAVVFHKIPEGMALSLVAIGSGMSRLKAFSFSVGLESLTTLAGGLAGLLFLFRGSSPWVGYILGHVGGGFVFLVIHALLSEVVKHHPRDTILAAIGGGLSIAVIGFFIGAF